MRYGGHVTSDILSSVILINVQNVVVHFSPANFIALISQRWEKSKDIVVYVVKIFETLGACL